MISWRVPRMWEGGECWIIGGGPSLTEQFDVSQEIVDKVLSKELEPSAYSPYMKAIHSKHVIGINAAYLIGNWIDIVFFGDNHFFLENRKKLAEFPGLKISCRERPCEPKYAKERIKYLPMNKKHGKGISPNASSVCWNENSGCAAISVAVNTGATRIVLVGFDMKLKEDNTQHWHGLYASAGNKERNLRKLPFKRHLRAFPMIARDAAERNIEILNASPNSEIKEFRKVTVKELL